MKAERTPRRAAAQLRRLAGDDLHPGVLVALYIAKWVCDGAAYAANSPTAVGAHAAWPLSRPEGVSWATLTGAERAELADVLTDCLQGIESYNVALEGMTADLVGDIEFVLQRTPRTLSALSAAVELLDPVQLYPDDDARDAITEVRAGLRILAETLATSPSFAHSGPSSMLCHLLVDLADPKADETILDPWATWGETLHYAHATQVKGADDRSVSPGVFGFSATPTFHRIASLLALISREEQPPLTARLPNFSEDGDLAELAGGFEYVVSAPALRAPFGQHEVEGDGITRSGVLSGLSETLAVRFALDVIHDDGCVILALPFAVLNRGAQLRAARLSWLNEDLVDTVIALPMGASSRHAIRTALLILRKSKPAERQGKVFFVNVSSAALDNRRYSSLHSEVRDRVVAAYRGYADVEGFSSSVSVEALLAAEGDLNPARYTYQAEKTGGADFAAMRVTLEALEEEREAAISDVNAALLRLRELSCCSDRRSGRA